MNTTNMQPLNIFVSFKFFLLILLFFIIAGCASSYPRIQRISSIPGPICQVAVLPFANESKFDQGGSIVYRVFVSELVRSGYFIISNEGDVRKIYRQLGIGPKQKPDTEQLRVLANQLNVQAIIIGKITDMEEKARVNEVETTLAVDMHIIDPETAAVIWRIHHKREGGEYRKVMHFGLVNTVVQLTRLVSQEVVNIWIREGGMEQCVK